MHPSEKKANDLSKLRKSMGNVFATRTFSRKVRAGGAPTRNSTADVVNIHQHRDSFYMGH